MAYRAYHVERLVMDSRQFIDDAVISIKGNQINWVGTRDRFESEGRHHKVMVQDFGRFWVFPGLINAHTHCPLSFLKGLCHGQKDMVERLFFRLESQLLEEHIWGLSFPYLYEGLLAGVTCFNEHYYFVSEVAKAMDQLGVRGVLAECIQDQGGPFQQKGYPTTKQDPILWQRARRIIDNWPWSSRLKPAVGPHASNTVSERLLRELAHFARSRGLVLHMHIAQNEREYLDIKKEGRFRSPVDKAYRCGALWEQSLLAHGICVDEHDVKLIKESGATLAYCPASQILFSRLAPWALYERHGVPVAVATDCAPSNDTADVLAELRLVSLLAQHDGMGVVDAQKLFRMATEIPARALGLWDEIGSLEVGKKADLVFLRKDAAMLPMHDQVWDQLIYGVLSKNVWHVMVDGDWVLYGGQLQKSDCNVFERYFDQLVAGFPYDWVQH